MITTPIIAHQASNNQLIYAYTSIRDDANEPKLYCLLFTNIQTDEKNKLIIHYGLGRNWRQPDAASTRPLIAREDARELVEIGNNWGRLEMVKIRDPMYHDLHTFADPENTRMNGFEISNTDIDGIQFCLYRPEDNAWFKDKSTNFYIDFSVLRDVPPCKSDLIWFKHVNNMTLSTKLATLSAADIVEGAGQGTYCSKLSVFLRSTVPNREKYYLHWGEFVNNEWKAPAKSRVLSNIVKSCEKSHETEFEIHDAENNIHKADLIFSPCEAPKHIAFVLRSARDQWFVSPSGDCLISMPMTEAERATKLELSRQKEDLAKKRLAEWERTRETFSEIRLENLTEIHRDSKCFPHLLTLIEGDLAEDYGSYKFFVTRNVVASESDTEDGGSSSCSDTSSKSNDSSSRSPKDVAGPLVVEEVIEPKVCISMLLCTKQTGLICHWGVKIPGEKDWVNPLKKTSTSIEACFAHTTSLNNNACDSVCAEIKPGIYAAEFVIPVNHALTEGACEGICMVWHDVVQNKWLKNPDGNDIFVRVLHAREADYSNLIDQNSLVACGSQPELAKSIVECECVWESMTLWHRYNLIMERIREVSASTVRDVVKLVDFWSWIFVWLRFNQLSWLDWQRRYNTRPSMLAHSTMELSLLLSEKWRAVPEHREWLRLAVSCVGRGGNQGQRIRDQILEIMHKHKISERAGHFYEQWHQKLHNNTTPDDVGICKALIKFYETNGDMNSYWRTLQEYSIDRAKLASYERPIVFEPYLHDCDRGELLRDFYHYLDVLMDVHDCRDLWRSLQRVRHALNDNVSKCIENEIAHLRNLNAEETVNRIKAFHYVRSEVSNIAQHTDNNYLTRDLLLLDFALASLQSAMLQNTKRDQFSISQAVEVLIHLLHDCQRSMSSSSEWAELTKDFTALGSKAAAGEFTRNIIQDSLMVKALLDRLVRAVGEDMERVEKLIGPKARLLGQARRISDSQLNVFVDEVLRGSVLFSVSQLISVLEPKIRERAKMTPWQIISPVKCIKGVFVEAVPALEHLQSKIYSQPTLLISGRISGEEDIPEGVVGIIVRDAAAAPDVLSHVSVRARNAGVLLTVCFDKELIANIEGKFVGQYVDLELVKGFTDVDIKQSEYTGGESRVTNAKSAIHHEINDLRQLTFGVAAASYCASEENYNRSVVGSKSHNLKIMKDSLSQLKNEYEIPLSFAFVFGSFEKCLLEPENEKIRSNILKIAAKCKSCANRHIQKSFAKIEQEIQELVKPSRLQSELADMLTSSGIAEVLKVDLSIDDWWTALKKVWLSVFQMRPWVALSKAGRSWSDLSMAVLVQPLIDADYAFVLHSRHPYRDEDSRDKFMYGELVQGLGEVLVGNYPGRALSWECERGSNVHTIISWPSKSKCLKNIKCLMFRSDSNGEDLDDFAGAGLFESVSAIESRLSRCCYSDDPLIIDPQVRQVILERVTQTAWDVEDQFKGRPMDVEGCVVRQNNVIKVHIVQCRPQV